MPSLTTRFSILSHHSKESVRKLRFCCNSGQQTRRTRLYLEAIAKGQKQTVIHEKDWLFPSPEYQLVKVENAKRIGTPIEDFIRDLGKI